MPTVKKLIKILKNRKNIFIQTHNYPDHDSVASAFALQFLLKSFKIESKIIYHGEILRDSLQKMVEKLGIKIFHHSRYELNENDTIIIVDANKKGKNVALLKGEIVAVIDHHQGEIYDDLDFCDIRSDYGACATIIFSYFAEIKLEPSVEVATAIHTAISFDTCQFTRNTNPLDLETVAFLCRASDVNLVNQLVRNSIKIDDLIQYRRLLENVKIKCGFAYCHFQKGCDKNLLAILSDFLLTVEEVHFVVLTSKYLDEILFSIRSEDLNLPANAIIQDLLSGIGSGGGHIDMAGGKIPNIANFNEEKIYNSFLKRVVELKKNPKTNCKKPKN